NRRGRGIAGFANSLKNLRREAEFVKCHIKGPVHLDFTARLGPPSGPWTDLSLRSRQGRAVLRVFSRSRQSAEIGEKIGAIDSLSTKPAHAVRFCRHSDCKGAGRLGD